MYSQFYICNYTYLLPFSFFFFFFNDTATTEIYTLSLHDALPISPASGTVIQLVVELEPRRGEPVPPHRPGPVRSGGTGSDRKSTRLNSSHANISYAVFCLKKKKKKQTNVVDKLTHQMRSTHEYVN